LGFSIIPVVHQTKTPAVKWSQFQVRKATSEELSSWFGGPEPRNIGVVTGLVSCNLSAIDFDSTEMYRRFFDAPRLESETIAVRTSRGVHVYTRSATTVRSFRIPELEIDVKSEGSFVLAPPSVHPSGHVYSFLNPSVKHVIEVENLVESIWLRAEQLGIKRPKHVQHFTPVIENPQTTYPPYRGRTPICIERLLEGVSVGKRDDAAIRLAQYYLISGLDARRIVIVLLEWNRRNRPPIGEGRDDPRNVEAYFNEKVRSATRTGRFGCSSLSTVSGICVGSKNCEFFHHGRRMKKWKIRIHH